MANKPGDDTARDILYEWGKTQPGERLLGTYPNAFGDLRDLIAAKVEAARQAAYTWRHLDESKPHDDTVCLVTDEGLQPCVARYIASTDRFTGPFTGYDPQWWLPIPASPAAEARKEGEK